MNKRILDSGPKDQDEGDARNHGLQDPHVYVVFWDSADGTIEKGLCAMRRKSDGLSDQVLGLRPEHRLERRCPPKGILQGFFQVLRKGLLGFV